MGDLIHAMYAIKHVCAKEGVKGNLYISDGSYGNVWGCGHFAFSLEKTLNDVKDLVLEQEYIEEFKILPKDFNEEYICLQQWRKHPPIKSWSNLLSEEYNFDIPDEYPWITTTDGAKTKGKVLIHYSNKRHNYDFPWNKVINDIENEILFITSHEQEFNEFKFKHKIKPYIVETVSDMAKAIKSCDLFIGNQSLPLAIATSLDIPRICVLHESSYKFYSGEHHLSNNTSWFLKENLMYNGENIKIKL